MDALDELEALGGTDSLKDTNAKRESYIEKKVNEHARSKGWWVRKFKSPGNNGEPDRIYMKQGRVFFIEFKKPNEKPRADQDAAHDEIRAHGGTVYTCDDIALGRRIIDSENDALSR